MMQPNDTGSQPYTMPEWITLIGTIGAVLTGVIAAIASAIISVRTNWVVQQTQRDLRANTEMTSKNTEITNATYTEAKVISGHVNSERSKLDERIVSKERENDLLKSELGETKQVAALLAQTASNVVRQRQPDPNAPHNRRAEDRAAAETLAKIEANTRETSEGIQELNEQ